MLTEAQLEQFGQYLPFFQSLSEQQRTEIRRYASVREFSPSQLPHAGKDQCTGLVAVGSGQLRAYITSAQGRQITLYRLLERDVCIISASCIIKEMAYDICIEAEKQSSVFILPSEVYERLNNSSPEVKDFTLSVVSARFTEIMWVLEQLVFSSQGQRLANLLLEHMALEGADTLHLTHEAMAADLGTAREVVTRLLKYLQDEGVVSLSRGAVTILDRAALRKLG